jgi:hypothetical protein
MITKKLAPYTKTLENSDCIKVIEIDPIPIKENEDHDYKEGVYCHGTKELNATSGCSKPDNDTTQQHQPQLWRIPAPGTTHNKFQSNQTLDGKGNYRNLKSCMRVVTPGICAICLHGFEVSHAISWSSNPACVHCFHEDCIQSWLWNCYIKRLAMDEEDDDYDDNRGSTKYPCPCCRQEFIMPTSKFNC